MVLNAHNRKEKKEHDVRCHLKTLEKEELSKSKECESKKIQEQIATAQKQMIQKYAL